MSKKKICFIAQFPPPMHGLSKAVETLYNSELNKEFDFEKVDIKDNKKFLSSLVKISKSKADLFYFTISQSKGGNLRDLIIFKLLQLQDKKCLIHLHGGYYRQLVDNDLPDWQRKMNYKAIGKVEGAIVLGESLKPIFEGMLSDDKIYIVPNCVDDEFLMSDDEFEEKLRTIDERKIKHVLYLSNFIKSKGYPEVLEMAKLEKERCESGEERKFHFDFAGKFFEQSEKEFFFSYIKENKLDDYVTYHGVVGGDKKRELLKKCDIFALLTRYPKEGQPISILEAMGNGMVVVTTNHAGIPDIVEDGVNGIILDINQNVKNVYDKILEKGNAMLIQNGYEKILSNYKSQIYIHNMEIRLYDVCKGNENTCDLN
jgi:glycosyltransferase involved in cell wall biosynthesis